jgi:hypothetical protein
LFHNIVTYCIDLNQYNKNFVIAPTKTKLLYRALVLGIFKDENSLANSNADSIRKKNPDLINACKGI